MTANLAFASTLEVAEDPRFTQTQPTHSPDPWEVLICESFIRVAFFWMVPYKLVGVVVVVFSLGGREGGVVVLLNFRRDSF